MPTITEILADTWEVEQDVEQPLQAASFSVTFTKVTAAGVWDPAIYNTLKVYRGEAAPDLVRIRAVFDGEDREIILGVADRIGRQQTEDGVKGTIAGRDRMALILDGFTSEAFTIDGINVDNDGVTVVPRRRYQEAVTDLAFRAGLGVIWDVGTDDYAVGRSLPVTTETTFGEAIAALLEPWRFSERHAHDAWVEGNNLRIRKRDPAGAGEVTINFERLIVDEFDRAALPIVSDVQVKGATYQALVDDPAFFGGEQCSHYRYWTTSYDSDPAQLKTDYSEATTEEYGVNCELLRSVQTREYRDGLRTEVTETLNQYNCAACLPLSTAGNIVRSDTTKRVKDSREGKTLFYDLINSKRRTWTYFVDNGDTESETELDREFDESAPATEARRILKTFRYRRTRGQSFRDWEVTETDPTTGAVSRTFGSSEVGALKLSHGQGSSVPQGKKQEERQIACGADSARRKVSSDMIGDAAAACLIRTRVLEDHANYKVTIVVRMTPDSRIVRGKRVTIAGAPAFWDVTTFTVLSSRITSDAKGSEQEIRAIGWVTPPV